MPMAAEEFPCLGDPGVVARFHGRAVPAIEIAGRGFVGRDVLEQEFRRALRRRQVGDLRDLLRVRMGDELVAPAAHILDVVLEGSRVHAEMAQEPGLEGAAVLDHFRPVMLAGAVGEELAPIEHRDVDRVAVHLTPEAGEGRPLLEQRLAFLFLPGAKVRQVPGEAGAQQHDAAQTVLLAHGLLPPSTAPAQVARPAALVGSTGGDLWQNRQGSAARLPLHGVRDATTPSATASTARWRSCQAIVGGVIARAAGPRSGHLFGADEPDAAPAGAAAVAGGAGGGRVCQVLALIFHSAPSRTSTASHVPPACMPGPPSLPGKSALQVPAAKSTLASSIFASVVGIARFCVGGCCTAFSKKARMAASPTIGCGTFGGIMTASLAKSAAKAAGSRLSFAWVHLSAICLEIAAASSAATAGPIAANTSASAVSIVFIAHLPRTRLNALAVASVTSSPCPPSPRRTAPRIARSKRRRRRACEARRGKFLLPVGDRSSCSSRNPGVSTPASAARRPTLRDAASRAPQGDPSRRALRALLRVRRDIGASSNIGASS